MAVAFWDLAPWEQLPYCAAVKETNSAVTGTKVQITTPNNQRYGLIIASNVGGSSFTLSTNATGSAAGGLLIPTTAEYIIFTTNQHGILPTLAWYITTTGPWTTIELIAENWPKEGDHYLDNINHPAPLPSPTVLPSGEGVNGQRGVLSYWQQLMAKIKGG